MESKIPTCVGVIIDGNRRYAKESGISKVEGHRAGYKNLRRFVIWAKEAGIKHVIAYTFSTENWNRSEEEVGYLMDLLRFVFKHELDSIKKEGIRLRIVGETSRFSEDIQKLLKDGEKETESLHDIELTLALSYGGRAELLQAVNSLIGSGVVKVNEMEFSDRLWTAGLPDPDMIIRTGGELRLSNFLPWQSSYSELFFTDTLWPAFTKKEFEEMLNEYSDRDRRRGK